MRGRHWGLANRTATERSVLVLIKREQQQQQNKSNNFLISFVIKPTETILISCIKRHTITHTHIEEQILMRQEQNHLDFDCGNLWKIGSESRKN